MVAVFRNGFWRRVWLSMFAAWFAISAHPAWAGGGKPATKLVNVADTRSLQPGFSKLVADIYNDNLLLFGLMVVSTMALMGLVLGLLFDRGLVLLGLDLGKLSHHE